MGRDSNTGRGDISHPASAHTISEYTESAHHIGGGDSEGGQSLHHGADGAQQAGMFCAAAPAGCESGQGSRGGMGAGRGYHWLLAISFPSLPCCPAAV